MINFDMYSGDTVDIIVDLFNADGFPLDVTNITMWWGMMGIIKTSPDEISSVGNRVTVHLSPEDTVDMSGPHKHQLRGVDPTGRVETFLYGVCRITESVFQPPTTDTVRVIQLVGSVAA